MGILGGLAKLVRPLAKVANAPILGNAIKALPVVGTVASVASIGSSAISAFGGSKGGGLPALPAGGAGLPALPGAGAPAIVGNRSVFRNDANVPDALKAFAISKGDLKTYYRSPLKGYVIRYDQNGDPFAIPKNMARAYFGWKPAKKPPISVGEHQSLKRAHRTINKVKKIHGLISYVQNNTTAGGRVKVHGKKKGGAH